MTRVISNRKFADQFPVSLKRLKKHNLAGTIIKETDNPDLFIIKWDDLKVPWSLHRSFFQIKSGRKEDGHGHE